ncbi:MAG: CYTH domain-containing protein, partial [Candidatus Hydrogenedentes bacterium]|nr:CYTH domain-containing protein [Candidatus Hydrogenedentota bacterium]
MGTEIERKFLVENDLWKAVSGPGVGIRQGYIAFGPPTAVRVRIAGEKANINIKKATVSISRDEFEYSVPMDDARFLLDNLCERHIIEKRRFRVKHEGHLWEIDVFSGVNTGLIVAEIELERED